MDKIWLRFYDEQVPDTVEYPDRTLYQSFQAAVEERPNGVATIFVGAKIRYQELGRLVDRFANVLASLGVQQGDRVALILPNIPAFPIAHFATMKLGAILVPTNPLYVERELEYQLNDAGVETVVILEQLYPRLKQVRDRTSVKRIVLMRVQDFLPRVVGLLFSLKNRSSADYAKEKDNDVYEYRFLMKNSLPSVSAAEVSPDSTAILLYTGGTTGISKGAVLTHRNLSVNVRQTHSWLWSIKEGEEVFLCVLPFFHSYGMTTGLHLSILTQSTMLLAPRFELANVVKQIKKYSPTIFCAVPSMYNAINHYPNISKSDVSSIRLCISGGAALLATVQEKFESLTGGKLVEGYGLSETSPVALVNPTHGHRKSGTIGVPIPDTEARIVDPERGDPLPPQEVGELAIRGPQVMCGYWNMPEETERVLRQGWLHTGDMAVMDGEGFFTIVDRKKDLIISAGMNVYPREVEEVLHQHPKIVEAAVLGISSPVRGEIVKAFIVVEEGEEIKKQEISQFCRDKLARYKIPKEIQVINELPKSAMGKVLKRILKDESSK